MPGNAPWAASGSYAGSLGVMGTSLGKDRDRELDAAYTRDFTCCGKQLSGLHELLEHYEKEHADLAPDLRIAALNAAQSGYAPPVQGRFQSGFAHSSSESTMRSRPPVAAPSGHHGQQPHPGDVPTPPGMMDIEMDEPSGTLPAPTSRLPYQSPETQPPPHISAQQSRQTAAPSHSQPARVPSTLATDSASHLPWSTTFGSHVYSPAPPQCLPPSLLSFAPGQAGTHFGLSTPPLDFDSQSKPYKKASKKVERMAVREEANGSDAEGEKRYPCPIEGCGKVYKQANGLKYHLTRSINSGHGNLAELGGLAAVLGERNGGNG